MVALQLACAYTLLVKNRYISIYIPKRITGMYQHIHIDQVKHHKYECTALQVIRLSQFCNNIMNHKCYESNEWIVLGVVPKHKFKHRELNLKF